MRIYTQCNDGIWSAWIETRPEFTAFAYTEQDAIDSLIKVIGCDNELEDLSFKIELEQILRSNNIQI